MIASVGTQAGAPVVVELGPGTGAMTTAIEARLAPDARHVAIELDPRMVGFLRQAHPGLEVVEGDAAKLARAARRARDRPGRRGGLRAALGAVRRGHAGPILAQVAPGDRAGTGAFTTFAYLHGMTLAAARRFRRTLRATFDEVVRQRHGLAQHAARVRLRLPAAGRVAAAATPARDP